MAITNKRTRKFKESQCAHCKLSNKKAMKNGKPYCGYEIKNNKEPDTRNGECTEIKRGK